MDLVRVRVTNALTGQELLPETGFSGSQLREQVLAALGSRPSRPVTLLREGAVVEELGAAPGDRIEVTALVRDALSDDERERHLQRLGQSPRDAQSAFGSMPEAARDDAAVVLAAVRADARCLQHATEPCRKDPAIVRATVDSALQQNLDLMHVFRGSWISKEIALLAIQQHPCSLQGVGRTFQEDRDVVLAAVRRDGRVLQHAARSCRQDRLLVLAAVQQNPRAFAWAGPQCEKDEEIRRWAGVA